MAVNDTVLLEVIGTAGGQQHIHTLHFRYADPAQTEQGLIDDWQANCRTAYRTCFSTADLIVQLLRARQVCGSLPLRAAVEEVEPGATQAGTVAPPGERAPSWLASLTNLRTASAGPSRRGRFFLGGLYEGWINGNELVAGVQATRQAYADSLMAFFGPAGVATDPRLVVHSRKLASVPLTQCQDSSTIITSTGTDLAIASMKSRKPGRGL